MGSRISSSNNGLPISRITVGSLEDMGYEVDYSKADPLFASDLSPNCVCTIRRGFANITESPKAEMSARAHAEAVAYGKSILETVSESLSPPALPEGVIDRSRDWILILYEEDGEVHSVFVRSTDSS